MRTRKALLPVGMWLILALAVSGQTITKPEHLWLQGQSTPGGEGGEMFFGTYRVALNTYGGLTVRVGDTDVIGIILGGRYQDGDYAESLNQNTYNSFRAPMTLYRARENKAIIAEATGGALGARKGTPLSVADALRYRERFSFGADGTIAVHYDMEAVPQVSEAGIGLEIRLIPGAKITVQDDSGSKETEIPETVNSWYLPYEGIFRSVAWSKPGLRLTADENSCITVNDRRGWEQDVNRQYGESSFRVCIFRRDKAARGGLGFTIKLDVPAGTLPEISGAISGLTDRNPPAAFASAKGFVTLADFTFTGTGAELKDACGQSALKLSPAVVRSEKDGLVFTGKPDAFAEIILPDPAIKYPVVEAWLLPDFSRLGVESGDLCGILHGPHGAGYRDGYRLLCQKESGGKTGETVLAVSFQMNFGTPAPASCNIKATVPENRRAPVYVCASYDGRAVRLQMENVVNEIPATGAVFYQGGNNLHIGAAQWPFLGSIQRVRISQIGAGPAVPAVLPTATEKKGPEITDFDYLSAIRPVRTYWSGRESFVASRMRYGSFNKRPGKTPFPDVAYDETVSGEKIVIGGKVYPKGIATPGKTWLEYKLNGQYTSFSAVLGGPTHPRGGRYNWLTFEFLGDGKLLYRSPTLHGNSPPLAVNIPLRGIDKLDIRCLSSTGYTVQLFFGDARLGRGGEESLQARYLLPPDAWYAIPADNINTLIYTRQEQMPMEVWGPAGATAVLKTVFTDRLSGQKSSTGEIALAASSGQETSVRKVLAPVPGCNGNYLVNFSVQSGGKEVFSSNAYVAVISPRRTITPEEARESIFGVNGENITGWADALAKIGVRWYRYWVDWSMVAPAKNEFDFRFLDDDMQSLHNAGLHTLAVLLDACCYPAWLDWGYKYVEDKGEQFPVLRYMPEPDNFGRYLQALLPHLKDYVDAYEVYNEWGPEVFGGAEAFPRIMKLTEIASSHIRQTDPGAKLLQGRTYGLIRKHLEDGMARYIDGTVPHPYRPGTSPEAKILDGHAKPGHKADIRDIIIDNQELLAPYSLNEVWLTEIRCDSPWLAGKKGYEKAILSAEMQAYYMSRIYLASLMSPKPAKIFYHAETALLADSSGVQTDPCKPHFVAVVFAEMANRLEGSRFVRSLLPEGDIRAELFTRRDGRSVAVFWTIGPEKENVVVKGTFSKPELVDICGNPLSFLPKAKNNIIEAGPGPVYLEIGDRDEIAVKRNFFTVETGGRFLVKGETLPFTVRIENAFGKRIGGEIRLSAAPEGKIAPDALRYDVEGDKMWETSAVLSMPEQAGGDHTTITARTTVADKELAVNRVVRLRPALSFAPLSLTETENETFRLEYRVWNRAREPRRGKVVLAPVSGMEALKGENRFEAPAQGTVEDFFVFRGRALVEKNQPVTIEVTGDSGGRECQQIKLQLLCVPAAGKPVVLDGSLEEWDLARPVRMAQPYRIVELQSDPASRWKGPDDLSADVYSSWDADGLHLAVVVKDDVFHPVKEPFTSVFDAFFKGDSLQVAIDPTATATNFRDVCEYGFAAYPEGATVYTIQETQLTEDLPEKYSDKPVRCATRKKDGAVVYEITMPWGKLWPLQPGESSMAGFSLLINDNDGRGRARYMEFGGGIGKQKDPAQYGAIILLPEGESGK